MKNFKALLKSEEAIMPLRDMEIIDISKPNLIQVLTEEVVKCENVEDKLKIIDRIIEILKY